LARLAVHPKSCLSSKQDATPHGRVGTDLCLICLEQQVRSRSKECARMQSMLVAIIDGASAQKRRSERKNVMWRNQAGSTDTVYRWRAGLLT